MVKRRINDLRCSENAGSICRIPGGMLYKTFSSVQYEENYRSISEFFLDPDQVEACGKLQFSSKITDGNFTQNPYWVDSIFQFASFALNSSASARDGDIHYTLSGWKSLRISKRFSPTNPYFIYVQMEKSDEDTSFSGDVYILDGDDIVASCFGLEFLEEDLKISSSSGSSHLVQSGNVSLTIPTRSSSVTRSAISQSDEHASKGARPCSASRGNTTSLEDVLEIVSREVSIDARDLEDDMAFSDIGVDSLLSHSILRQVQHMTGLKLPPATFTSYPTVGSFRKFLEVDTKEDSGSQSSNSATVGSCRSLDTDISATTESRELGCSSSYVDSLISIIVSNTGNDLNEINPNTRLDDLGVDSLMTIAILAEFKDKTGISVPHSLFMECSTVGKLTKGDFFSVLQGCQ